MRSVVIPAFVYLFIAVMVTWPAAVELNALIPGAENTEVWTTIWAYHHVFQSLFEGGSLFFTDALNFPRGGALLPNDVVGGLLSVPFAYIFGPMTAFSLLIISQLAFAGWSIHMFSRDLLLGDPEAETPRWGPWVSGISLMISSLLMSHLHNGTVEALSVGWTILAVWMAWRASTIRTLRSAAWAGVCLAIAFASHRYGGIVAFIFAGALLIGRGENSGPFVARHRWMTIAIGLLLSLPVGYGFAQVAQSKHSLTKQGSHEQVQEVTRTTGSADALVYVRAGRKLSPDFQKLQPSLQRSVHVHYLGLVALSLTIWGWRRCRQKRYRFLLAGGIACLVLSLGPVWVHDGRPLLLSGDLAVPLPYFLLEGLPGFRGMNSPWRLSIGPVIALSMLAGIALHGQRGRYAVIGIALLCLDARVLSPAAEVSTMMGVEPSQSIMALSEAPQGAVINYPFSSGGLYLYEQTVHGKPLAGTLNDVANARAMRLWRRIRGSYTSSPDTFHSAVSSTAKRLGIRYLVIHTDPDAEPDVYSAAVRKIEKLFPVPEWGQGQTRVVPLW